MALIVVGMIVLIIGIVIGRNPSSAQRYAGIVRIVGNNHYGHWCIDWIHCTN